MKKIVMTGGGTAGHVTPNIALFDSLQKDGYDILNEGFTWTEDMTPQIRITLTADDDYYFTSLGKDKITLKGGAEYKSSTRQN